MGYTKSVPEVGGLWAERTESWSRPPPSLEPLPKLTRTSPTDGDACDKRRLTRARESPIGTEYLPGNSSALDLVAVAALAGGSTSEFEARRLAPGPIAWGKSESCEERQARSFRSRLRRLTRQ